MAALAVLTAPPAHGHGESIVAVLLSVVGGIGLLLGLLFILTMPTPWLVRAMGALTVLVASALSLLLAKQSVEVGFYLWPIIFPVAVALPLRGYLQSKYPNKR